MGTNYHIIKLSFQTPLHIGLGKENYDFSSSELHADVLTSALASVRAMHGKTGDLETFLQSFSLSSAFPFCKEEYFLPKPVGRIPVTVRNQEEAAYRKGLKGIRFIEKTLWERMMQGETLCVEDEQIQGDFLIQSSDHFEKPYMHQVSQRVEVIRNGDDDTLPFYFDWTYFNKDCGFYCLTDAQGELFEEVLRLFTLLGEYGIGSDRSVGGGHFTVSSSTLDFSLSGNGQQLMLLSTYIPTEEEHRSIHWAESKFSLIDRGGYMSGSDDESLRHLWKRSVYMVNEGSLLKGVDRIQGKVVDLSPLETSDFKLTHPVFRSGRVFCLPVKMKEA